MTNTTWQLFNFILVKQFAFVWGSQAIVFDGLISSPSTALFWASFALCLLNSFRLSWTKVKTGGPVKCLGEQLSGFSCVRRSEVKKRNLTTECHHAVTGFWLFKRVLVLFVRAELLDNSLTMSSLSLSLEWKRKLFACGRSSDVSGMFEVPF